MVGLKIDVRFIDVYVVALSRQLNVPFQAEIQIPWHTVLPAACVQLHKYKLSGGT